MNKEYRIILASASPRRKELLKHIFAEYDVIPSESEENAEFRNPEDFVMDLSYRKAYEVYEKVLADDSNMNGDDFLVIGCDTIVYLDGKVLGKPDGKEGAKEMLKSLSGKKHSVYTGICIMISDGRVIKAYEKTDVYVDMLLDSEIDAYVLTGDPLDKAGAYGIQGDFSKHISKIDGDYFNVVGLPVNKLYKLFKAENVILY